MPTKEETALQIANQMIKSGRMGRVKIPVSRILSFKMTHDNYINWVIDNMPTVSAAVSAVVVKAMIRYNKNRIANFCKALKNCRFEGTDDPVYLLWRFLQTHKGKNTETAYRRTVTAVRAYAEGKKLQNLTLTLAKRDIFDWDEDLTVPDYLLDKWNPNELPHE